MSTLLTAERLVQTSPRFLARMAGLVAVITTTAAFANFVIGNMVVPLDAVASAHHILANELLYRLAAAGDVISVLYIVYTLLIYYLFRPVNRSLALLAALFSLVGIAVGMLIPFFDVAALIVLKDAQPLHAFTQGQLQGMALLFLQLRAWVDILSIMLFGAYDILTGYLIVRSTFMPRLFGVWWAIAGVVYLIYSFATILAPDFAAHLSPWIVIPGLADLVIPVWLLVFGVNERRWKEQASAAGGPQ
jgi:Domain of unknown function (DUF4386)